jgi:hypothetical protein
VIRVRRLALGAALACTVAHARCSSADLMSSDGDGDVSGAAALSSGLGLTLGFFVSGLFTEGDAAGRALESRRELSLAIARGSGPFVTDLAAWLELPPALLPELGQALRDARTALEPALAKPISLQSFETLIGVALCKSPPIRYHAWKRFNCERLVPLSRLSQPPADPTP